MGRAGISYPTGRAGEIRSMTVRRALDPVLMPGAHILVYGAEIGLYSFPYATENLVTVVEPDPEKRRMLHYAAETFDRRLNLKIVDNDPCHLTEVSDNICDVVLLIGTGEEARAHGPRILAEACRVTHVDGHVLVTFRNRDMVPIAETIQDPAWFAAHPFDPEQRNLIPSGNGVYSLEGARELMSHFPLHIVSELAADGPLGILTEQLQNMPETAYENYLAWHLERSAEPTALAATRTFLFVCRKQKDDPIELWDAPDVQDEIARFQKTPFFFRGHFFKGLKLEDGPVSLELDRTTPAWPAKRQAAAYTFRILYNGRDSGVIALRLGYTEKLYYVGHVGYQVYPKYRGRGVATAACRLIGNVAREHKMPFLAITNDVRNAASVRVCEKLGATKRRTVLLPPEVADELDQYVTNIFFYEL